MHITKQVKKLALIDASSYIFRAYYAVKGLATSKGFPTGAIFGFHNMLRKVIDEIAPDYLAVAYDVGGPTFRHEIYPEYKANRKETPEDLVPQLPKIKEMVSAYNIYGVECSGFEADDIIGTIVEKLKEDVEVVIVTGDKDFAQLVDKNVTLLDTMKDTVTDLNEVRQKYGKTGRRLLEVFGLSGDTSDNIPGVPGIGMKTAVELIKKYGSIDNIMEKIDDFKGKRRENLENYADTALMSRRLFTIDSNVPIEVSLDEMGMSEPDTDRLKELFTELEFHTLLKGLNEPGTGIDVPYKTIFDRGELEEIVKRASGSEWLSVDLETTSKNPMDADIVGISLSFEEDSSYYIPIAHDYLGAEKQLPRGETLGLLTPLLTDPGVKKIGQNIKYDYIILKRNGIEISPINFDTMVASYIINPSRRAHNLDAISLEYLGHRPISYTDVTGKGKGQLSFNMVRIEEAAPYAAEDSFLVFKLMPVLKERLREHELMSLFDDIEVPLISVLADMEIKGVMVDEGVLKELSLEFARKTGALREKIIEEAGQEFNINSPKQLGHILFEVLGLPVTRRTKTGPSTNSDVLGRLATEHAIAEYILEYRSLTKLISTYVDSLPKLINSKTGRIHTSFNQAITATGRLSSSGPNLQNIPIRTPEGRRIREAFIPGEGCVFVSSDYSQIELRVLAHLSGDPVLKDAFLGDEDIHRSTASLIFQVGSNDVTHEMRRRAKTINFGIIYGISAYGLAKELKIPMSEAQEFIDDYFKKFSGVKTYLEGVMAGALDKGYVTTIMGRKRYLPELKSGDKNTRSNAERMAINTPVQGSAADIIKIAMVNLNRRIDKEGLFTNMLIQVHDELVLEAPEDEVERVIEIVREEMEGVMELSVPLKVDIDTGINWSDAH